jgi:hypothetical protein
MIEVEDEADAEADYVPSSDDESSSDDEDIGEIGEEEEGEEEEEKIPIKRANQKSAAVKEGKTQRKRVVETAAPLAVAQPVVKKAKVEEKKVEEKKKAKKVVKTGIVVPGKKGKQKVDEDAGAEIIASSKVRDVSRPTANFLRDKFLLGDRYSIQIGQINVKAKNFSYESIIFTRDPPEENPDGKKKFTFNMPSKLVLPLRDAINEIISQTDEKYLK